MIPPMTSPSLASSTLDLHDPEAVAAAVREAIDRRRPLVDYGVAHEGLGHPPPAEHTRLRLQGEVSEHYVADFGVRVAAGCTLADLQDTLARAGQFLPVDGDDDLTVGELIVHHVYGRQRVGYGSIRDLLLGLSLVTGEAEHVHVGGRTVKNVAGYDVTRLMVGSLGELGVVTEATVKTFARPDTVTTVELTVEDAEELDRVQTEWLVAEAMPAAMDLTRLDAHGPMRMHVAFHGASVGRAAQLESLQTLVESWSGVTIETAIEEPFDRHRDVEATRRAWRRTADAVVKVVVPPASTGFLCTGLDQLPAGDPARLIEAMPFHGCVFVGGALDADAAARLDEQIEHLIQPVGGFRVWYRLPTGAERIAPFAPRPTDWDTLCRIKAAMDPHGILNPNRFLPAKPEDA